MKILLISLIYFTNLSWSKVINTQLHNNGYEKLNKLAHSQSIARRVKKGEIVSVAKVESSIIDKMPIQTLKLYGAGLHPKSCRFAMRKLSLYENYHQYVGVIKKSSYNDASQRITFNIDSSLLPFSMIMDFKMARITGKGVYPFTFDKGFLKGLKGQIYIFEEKKTCLLLVKADFQGPETPINNTILEFFSQAIIKLALENLIRISKTY